jgi:GTP-binding protein EngB required for normal cell division
MKSTTNSYPYSQAVIGLLKGVIYENHQETWRELLKYETEIKNYFEVMNLTVFIDTSEGYAFLRQPEPEDDDLQNSIPRLIEKRQLSYPVTLLLVQLRKALLENDAIGGETRVIIEKEKLRDMLRIFLPETTNEAKTTDKIDEYINKVIEFGFLRKLKNNQNLYEINRIIKAKISADTLHHIEKVLKEYANSIN